MIAALADLLATPAVAIILTGAAVSVAASLLGTFLVLRGEAMLTDAVSHSIVFGIVVTWMLTGAVSGPWQFLGAGLTALLTVALVQALAATRRLDTGAAIGLVFPALFSVGVLLINLYGRDAHVDADTVLLGEIAFVWLDTVDFAGADWPRALLVMLASLLLNLAFVGLLYKELKLASFDAGFAASLGLHPTWLGRALLGLTGVTAVAGFDAVGAVLFIAFAIVPPAAAHLLVNRLSAILIVSGLIGAASAFLGYHAAVWLDVSIGGAMALTTGVFFVGALLFGPRDGVLARRLRRRDRETADAVRALAVHLFNHENDPTGEESRPAALREHLMWPDAYARRILIRALDRGHVARRGDRLTLTEKGRALAREVVAPV